MPPQSVDYPPEQPACLRGHTPTTIAPSKVRVKPQRSVRGPRGIANIPNGMFNKPGVLGGLDVSPWVVEEEMERAQRAVSHSAAVSKVGGWRSTGGLGYVHLCVYISSEFGGRSPQLKRSMIFGTRSCDDNI